MSENGAVASLLTCFFFAVDIRFSALTTTRNRHKFAKNTNKKRALAFVFLAEANARFYTYTKRILIFLTSFFDLFDLCIALKFGGSQHRLSVEELRFCLPEFTTTTTRWTTRPLAICAD